MIHIKLYPGMACASLQCDRCDRPSGLTKVSGEARTLVDEAGPYLRAQLITMGWWSIAQAGGACTPADLCPQCRMDLLYRILQRGEINRRDLYGRLS